MSEPIQILSRHPLVGTWVHSDPDASRASFTIRATGGGFVVSGVALEDGEMFEISNVSWNDPVLRFTSRMPSTNHIVEHEFQVNSSGSVAHRFSLRETWVRAPADK